MNLEHESRGYGMTGQSGVPWNAFSRTSGLVAILSPESFK
jgi:hypothetical protein